MVRGNIYFSIYWTCEFPFYLFRHYLWMIVWLGHISKWKYAGNAKICSSRTITILCPSLTHTDINRTSPSSALMNIQSAACLSKTKWGWGHNLNKGFYKLMDGLIQLLTLWWVQGWISENSISALSSSLSSCELLGSEDGRCGNIYSFSRSVLWVFRVFRYLNAITGWYECSIQLQLQVRCICEQKMSVYCSHLRSLSS